MSLATLKESFATELLTRLSNEFWTQNLKFTAAMQFYKLPNKINRSLLIGHSYCAVTNTGK